MPATLVQLGVLSLKNFQKINEFLKIFNLGVFWHNVGIY